MTASCVIEYSTPIVWPARPVKFWDASAIVPLLIAEASTRRLQALAAGDPDILVWWESQVECASTLARLDRDGALDPQAAVLAFDRLKQLAIGWHEVDERYRP
jgi:uncharacterized protein with PIN domain